jgi:hypothetical protein
LLSFEPCERTITLALTRQSFRRFALAALGFVGLRFGVHIAGLLGP